MSGKEAGAAAVLELIESGDETMPAQQEQVAANDNEEESTGSTSEKGARRKRGRPSHKDALIRVADSCFEFWCNPQRVAHATFPVRGTRAHGQIRGRDFRVWLAGEYYRATGSAVGNQALDDCLRLLESRALIDGACHETFIRVGRAGNDRIFIDLGDETWRAIEVDRHGWQVISDPPVHFLRPATMRALPEPEASGLSIERVLRPFVNASDPDFRLVVAWLVAAWRPSGPFPILVANGEMGAGKSVFSRMLRTIIDPSVAPVRSAPRDERDLVIAASNAWVLGYDNLSGVAPWASDALCRLATGGGFQHTRAEHKQ